MRRVTPRTHFPMLQICERLELFCESTSTSLGEMFVGCETARQLGDMVLMATLPSGCDLIKSTKGEHG